MRQLSLLAIVALCFCTSLLAEDKSFTINNTLKQSWPWELTYKDYPAGTFNGPVSIKMNGQTRPAQVEKVTENGKTVDRLWFIATILADKKVDSKGRQVRSQPPEEVSVEIISSKTSSDLTIKKESKSHTINNGLYEFKLNTHSGKLASPTPLEKLPHWLAGMRLVGQDKWFGRAWFEGTNKVTAIHTKIIQQGPVFIDYHIVYEFEDNGEEGTTQAAPVELGKQTHKWKPNQPPYVDVPKKKRHYELKIRFILNDAWIEIVERYALPRDPSVGSWGIHQYYMHFGNPTKVKGKGSLKDDEFLKVENAMWTRWFEYDVFGGNTDLNIIKCEPRKTQRGHPFAQLRPRWNQGPGGAQEFFVTHGGKGPAKDRKGNITREADPGYSPENTAAGIVAAYPSKWVGPYAATIAAYAYDGNRAQLRFPLMDGSIKRSGFHYGNRAYAICVGPRKLFDNTGKMNSFIRRHTDWTLAAVMNKYILEWERDPSVAGANILLSKEDIKRLQADYKANKDTAEVRALQAFAASTVELRKEYDALKAQVNQPNVIQKELIAIKNKYNAARKKKDGSDKELKKQLDAKNKAYNKARNDARSIGKQLKAKKFKKLIGTDAKLYNLIAFNKGSTEKGPDPSLYLQRRYQDDALNPTNFGNRRSVNGPFPMADLFSIGKPFGGPKVAAIGYIYSDLDAWPGWHQGWNPGNPNFHTDKYMAALYAGAAMQDHPHAKEWLEFGKNNLMNDFEKVMIAPDGVGWECPGYSGYSFFLQLEIARVLLNAGVNPIVDNPLIGKSATWHRKLITPYDKRIGMRHEAPHGDTHRWSSGFNIGFSDLSRFYKKTDPAFASELMGTWHFLQASGLK